MKLLGIELLNYAGITHQYLPFSEGKLRLLVGKNNSGKSATLKFLAAAKHQEIASYIRGNELDYNVVFELEDDDGQFQQADISHPEMLRDGATLSMRFRRQSGNPNQTFLIGNLSGRNRLKPRTVISSSHPNVINVYRGDQPTAQTPYKGTNSLIARCNALLSEPIFIAPHRSISANVQMSTLKEVPSNGANLPNLLQTLNNEERDVFRSLEQAFCRLFPEFSQIDLVGNNNSVRIMLRRPNSTERVAITQCGNGLEQALIILAAIYTAHANQVILLDEPHNFLHPGAERTLLKILVESKRTVIAATHSPVLINGIPASQISLLQPPGTSFEEYWANPAEMPKSEALENIGFRNSDALFHDFLVFVEGSSDAEILPILLVSLGVGQESTGNIGFPVLEGVAKLTNPDKVQIRLIMYEKLLASMGEKRQKHLYLFDQDRNFLRETLDRTRTDGTPMELHFTPKTELENALLIPESIEKAVKQQAALDKAEIPALTAEEIRTRIDQEEKNGTLKGSEILESIYSAHNLVYDKRMSGRLLARSVPENHPAVRELCRPILKMIGIE